MTTTRRVRQLGNCMRQAKNPYRDRAEAAADAARVLGESGVTLYPYECACGWWHLSRRKPYVCRCGWSYDQPEDLAGHLAVSNTSHGPASPSAAAALERYGTTWRVRDR